MTDTLHIFALNTATEVSHTHLTRQKGETPTLPPLADWLGVDSLDTDAIEIFPISDLGGMALSDYVSLAFAPAAIPREIQARLDALEGGVLLVPDTALPAAESPGADPTPTPGPNATLIATLPLALPDHDAALPKADVAPTPRPAPAPKERESTPPIAFFALVAMAVVAAVIVLFGWD